MRLGRREGTPILPMHIASIHIHPVKSLRALRLEEARFDELGLENDRRFLIVERDGKAVTQRGDPRLALIATSLTPETLRLELPGGGGVEVPLRTPRGTQPARVAAEVWRASGMLADDCGEEAARWLSAFVGRPVKLVRVGEAFSRPMPVRKMPAGLAHEAAPAAAFPAVHASLGTDEATSHRVAFADAYPFLMLGEASLAQLNARLEAAGCAPVPMDRFRANLIVADAEAHEEDALGQFMIGGAGPFVAAGGCDRCIMTTTDQATGERNAEPLRTLAGYRRNPAKPSEVLFGQNLLHLAKDGMIKVGDRVTRLA